MTDPLVIALLAYNRPEYLARVLRALARCDGVADAVLCPQIEPGNDRVRTLIEEYAACEVRAIFNGARLGADPNFAVALGRAVAITGHVVLLEEDIVPAADFLHYHAWARDRYRSDPTVGSVAAYHRRDAPCPASEHHVVRRRVGFHGWGMATWADRLRPRLSDPAFLAGWDTHFDRHHRATGLVEVYPELSRCQNIGLATSVHADLSAAWFLAHHRLRYWAGSPGVMVQPGQFAERTTP